MRRPLTSAARGDAPADRGAAAVEFALVAPLLFLLLFGIIDYGIWFADALSSLDGARTAARAAATATPVSASKCPASGTRWTSALWPSSATYAKAVACTAVTAPVMLGSTMYVKVAFSVGDPGRGNLVTVCTASVQGAKLPLVPLPGDGMSTQRTTQAIEAEKTQLYSLNGGVALVGGQDVDPTGRNWSWC